MSFIQSVRAADLVARDTPQGQPLRYAVGSKQFRVWYLEMQPLAVSYIHSHSRSDMAIIPTGGTGLTLVTHQLHPMINRPDEPLFVPARQLHVGINLSAVEQFQLWEIRTDMPEHPDVQLAPQLQSQVDRLAVIAQTAFAAGRDVLAELREHR